MDPIKLCTILAVIFGATSFMVGLGASQTLTSTVQGLQATSCSSAAAAATISSSAAAVAAANSSSAEATAAAANSSSSPAAAANSSSSPAAAANSSSSAVAAAAANSSSLAAAANPSSSSTVAPILSSSAAAANSSSSAAAAANSSSSAVAANPSSSSTVAPISSSSAAAANSSSSAAAAAANSSSAAEAANPSSSSTVAPISSSSAAAVAANSSSSAAAANSSSSAAAANSSSSAAAANPSSSAVAQIASSSAAAAATANSSSSAAAAANPSSSAVAPISSSSSAVAPISSSSPAAPISSSSSAAAPISSSSSAAAAPISSPSPISSSSTAAAISPSPSPSPSAASVPSTTEPSTTPSTEGSKEYKGSGKIDEDWEIDYADSSTPKYKTFTRELKKHLTEVFKKSYPDDFLEVDVSNFRKGSIAFDFTVYLKATASVSEESLKDVIEKGEGARFTISDVSVKQVAGPTPTTSPTEKPEGSKEYKGSGKIDEDWEIDYADSSTPKYKTFTRELKKHLTEVFKKSYPDDFLEVGVSNFRKGSIAFNFTVYLKATASVSEDSLKDVIEKGEGSSKFTIFGVSVKQVAGPKPTMSPTEKPESAGLETWIIIVLIAALVVIVILAILLGVVLRQNRRLRSLHVRQVSVLRDNSALFVQPRMYSVSSKEMYDTEADTDHVNSYGLTTFSVENEGFNGVSNTTAYLKTEENGTERDSKQLQEENTL